MTFIKIKKIQLSDDSWIFYLSRGMSLLYSDRNTASIGSTNR